jgi:hypothetical protein
MLLHSFFAVTKWGNFSYFYEALNFVVTFLFQDKKVNGAYKELIGFCELNT